MNIPCPWMNIFQIINEPMAPAITYGLNKRVASKLNILTFNLFGGSFVVGDESGQLAV